MSDHQQLLFRGNDGTECELFISAVRLKALGEGKARDNEWMADFAAACMVGPALRWFETLDEITQGDWRLLRRALLDKYPQSVSGGIVPAAAAAASAPPSAAPGPLSTTNITSTMRRGRIRIESSGPFLRGYVSQNQDGGRFLRSPNPSEALIVCFKRGTPGPHELQIDSVAGQWLGLSWPNLRSNAWRKEKTYVANLAVITRLDTPSTTQLKTSSTGDQGANQHKVWTIDGQDELNATYYADDGVPYSLQPAISSRGSYIWHTLDIDRPEALRARLVFEDM